MLNGDQEELTPFEEARQPDNNLASAPQGSELTDEEVESVLASQVDPTNATNAEPEAS